MVHNDNHWDDPFTLGAKSKGGNCGIGESYGNINVGYRAFEEAVNKLCSKLDCKPIRDMNKEWRQMVGEAIYTIWVMHRSHEIPGFEF